MLTEYLQRVLKHVRATDGSFKNLYVDSLDVSPIPFFGDLASARVLTVGVNPAWTEFENRPWPPPTSLPEYQERLSNYFHLNTPSPHRWFDRWEESLNHLGEASYRVNAAHLDLSPRPTQIMSKVEAAPFLSMVAQDVGLFFDALRLCPQAKLLLIAGCVTNKYYMDDFIAKFAVEHGFRLIAESERTPGEAKVAYYSLINHERSWPVFFCSVSPSARNSSLLPQRISENRAKLLSYLNCACVTNN